MIPPMVGHLEIGGQRVMNAGFMLPSLGTNGIHAVGPSIPIYTRASAMSGEATDLIERMARFDPAGMERVELMGDLAGLKKQLGMTLKEIMRAITSSTTAFPVRENLEAPARNIVPKDTPLRNKLPRTIGAGTASQWRLTASMGGGFGFATTVTSGAASATQTVGSTAGMKVGDVLQFVTTTTGIPIGGSLAGSLRAISSITNATTVVLAATITTVTGDLVVNTGKPQGTAVTGTTTGDFLHGRPPGAGAPQYNAAGVASNAGGYFGRSFYHESGAPPDKVTSYIAKSAGYKLLGTLGSVTGFAMAAGANFQPQLATEKRNAIENLILNEENALWNGSATSVLPPWGDFTNALGFDGVINSISTANGTPPDHIQSSVGPLTLSHVDAQLGRITNFGGQEQWIGTAAQEILSFVHLAEAAGSIIRIQATMDGGTVLGLRVTGYVHPITGQVVPLMYSRFIEPGTLVFGSERLPDGTPALDVNVLPQVELPALEPNEMIQGYVARELAVTTSAIDVHPFVVTVYEVLRMFSGTVFAKSTGITAV
jgi:hypothetical protein